MRSDVSVLLRRRRGGTDERTEGIMLTLFQEAEVARLAMEKEFADHSGLSLAFLSFDRFVAEEEGYEWSADELPIDVRCTWKGGAKGTLRSAEAGFLFAVGADGKLAMQLPRGGRLFAHATERKVFYGVLHAVLIADADARTRRVE
jgi:hypothetical protein